MRIFSGVQPSGKLHLGNYFGAVRQFLTYQEAGVGVRLGEPGAAVKPLYFIADLHALTTVRDGARLRSGWQDVALDFLALGLDPAKAILFRQSQIPEVALLAWVLSTVTPMGLLERGHSYKDKLARGVPAEVGLFSYPVLMAADILLYGAEGVPVGRDQKQHLEFARDIATKFNVTFVSGYRPEDPRGEAGGAPGILQLPEALVLDEVAVIPGLDGQKMSKSYDNTLELFASDASIKAKIMAIKTDSTPIPAPKPPDAPLLTFLQLLAAPEEAAEIRRTWNAGGVGYGAYKKRLVELFHERFDVARRERRRLESDLGYVQQVLEQGRLEAHALAASMWQQVARVTGLA